MSYTRVIPRDLFNEANLLKMLGQLALKLDPDWGHDARLELICEDGWDITQSNDDGSIEAEGVKLYVAKQPVRLYRPLNSREPWPLWVDAQRIKPELDDFEVFDDEGNLSGEFRIFIGLGL